VAGCGKSRLASALMGRGREHEHRAVFGVGQKTVEPKVSGAAGRLNLLLPRLVAVVVMVVNCGGVGVVLSGNRHFSAVFFSLVPLDCSCLPLIVSSLSLSLSRPFDTSAL